MYQITCALKDDGYTFTLYDNYQPVAPEVGKGDVIKYSPGEIVVIQPAAFTESGPQWGSSPGWWSIQGCYFGLASSGPFGAPGKQYVEPVAVVLSDGNLQITDAGKAPATYSFFLQIRLAAPSEAPDGYPLQAVIIWDPELQNGGGSGT